MMLEIEETMENTISTQSAEAVEKKWKLWVLDVYIGEITREQFRMLTNQGTWHFGLNEDGNIVHRRN